ncbi:hypothetical protein [Arthrobacter sp. ES3-54]|nr:hypothetical protein [Arthrobacter sp. ES3-54]MDF9748687.1 hypothetical protein [Arthrobacter sp. ES3-54]
MSEQNPDGLAAARRYARWHLGDAHWADAILRAYANPEAMNKELDEEQG